MRNYILYPASKGSFSALCFLTFCLFGLSKYSYSQATVSNAFTYGNNSTPHIPLHLCESSLNLTINWQNATSNDSLVLYFPNSFEVDGLSNISILDSLSEIVGISFPVNSASGTLNLQFAYTGCLNQFSAINSALNTDDFAFQSYLLSSPSASSYTYNGNNMPLLGGNPATVSFSATTPTFEIASLLNGANFNGNANQIYQRRFSVSINSSAIDSFVLNLNQEADLQHLSLHIIDNNPSNGNFLPLLIHNDSCATSFSVPITLNSLIDYYAQPNNETRVLLFEQSVKLLCYQPNEQTNVQITRLCCPNNINYNIALNGKIATNQNFSTTSANVSAADLTENSCNGKYYYDISFQKTGSIALIDSLRLPFNGNVVSSIDSVYLIDSQNLKHPLNSSSFSTSVVNFNNLLLTIELFNEYNSSSNWAGFQPYANDSTPNNNSACSLIDSSWTPASGPWLNSGSFALRIKFDYNCKSQQNCSSPALRLPGVTFNGVNGQIMPAPIILYWRNSCESNELSALNNPNIRQHDPITSLDGFVEMDHEMEPDYVSYTFYPPVINPFTINNIPGLQNVLSDLSCDTSISYRAKFYIPLPDEAADTVDRILFAISDLIVDTNNIHDDSINFVNDSILYIPLGKNLTVNQPIDFNFNYYLISCPFPDPPNSGGIELICEIEAFCDHCEDCYKTIACNKLNVIVHCPGPCGGNVPMSTKNVNMERSTFGYKSLNQYPDFPLLSKFDFTQFVDSIIDSTNPYISPTQRELIHTGELSKLYPFDVVKLTSEGNIQSYANLTNLSTNQPFRFDKIAFELAHTPIGNKALFVLKEATLTFIDSINNTSFTAPLSLLNVNPSNTEVFGMSGDTLYSFELIIDSLANFPQLLDTSNPFSYRLLLNAEFWTLPDASNPINPIIVRGQFVCSTNVNEQITQYSCDPWGAQLRILVPQNDLSIHTQPDSTSHCKTKARISVTLDGGFGSNIDDFKYEFRPLIAYTDTAFSTQFVDGYGIQTPSDTVFFSSDTLVNLWNSTVNLPFLRAIEKPDSQFISLTSLRYCASGGDTIHYNLPIYDYAYITNQHAIDSLFVPLHLATPNPISLNDYAFFNPQDSLPLSETEIQSVDEPLWIYPSLNPLANLLIGIPSASQIQGISNADTLEFNLHLKAPDSLNMGNCWLSYSFSKSVNNAPPISVTTAEYSDSLDFLTDSLVLDTLGAYFHFFPNGFPLDSLSTVLKMPVACEVNQYRLKLKYGCFCDSTEFLFFKQHPDSIPSCIADSNWVNFERNNPQVNLYSNLIVSNDSSGCALVWNVQVENLQHSPNLTNGQLLINIPTGLVLNTSESTFQYFEPLDSLATSSGNYTLGDTLLPPDDYTFQFEDFPTPPTTVLVLAFPSVDTLLAGGRLAFNLKFKLDQSTCNLDSNFFQNNFLYRVLEARFTGQPVCADSLFKSDYILQDFLNDSIPSLQSQITNMTESADCCLPSAVTVSLKQACSDSTNGSITFHFSSDSTSNQIQLYKIDDLTNADSLVFDIFLPDSLYSTNQPAGLYSAIVTTSGGLVYVFNGLQIQNHGVLGNIHVIQDSQCSGSLIQLTALDSNAINQFPYNDSNPFVATSPTTYPALEYDWINSDVTVDTLNNSLASANPLNDTTYSVVISHLSGCKDTVSVKVDVIENVQGVIASIPNSICPLNSFELSLSPLNGDLFINGFAVDSNLVFPGAFASDTLLIRYQPDSTVFECPVDTTVMVIKDENLCNCQPCANTNNALIIPSSIVKTSQLSDSLLSGGTEIIERCVVINHNLEVDNDFAFTRCKITIGGGIEIKVTSRLSLYSDTLQGCEQMWKGIHNFSKLNMQNTLLKDAHFGVVLERITNQEYSGIRQCIFSNNFVGIKTSDNPGYHQLQLYGDSFIGGELLAPYPSQTPIPYTHSLAGIVITNGFYLNLDYSIRFKNLCNGLILHNKCIAEVNRSLFSNISHLGLSYAGANYWLAEPFGTGQFVFTTQNGNAIYANKNSYVFYTGYGGLSNSIISFQNCFRSIMVDASNLSVKNTRVSGGRFGFTARFMRSKKLTVNECHLSNTLKCIDLYHTDHIGAATINSCAISTPAFFSSNFPRKGIEVSNYSSAQNHIIENNDIFSNTSIQLTRAQLITISKNRISIGGMNGFGISAFNSPGATFRCNIINGTSLDSFINQKALSLALSPKCTISNNTSSNTLHGYEFNLNCTTDSFKLNTINNHKVGLRIPILGMLGIQNNNGNRWTGNYTITSGNTGAWAQINPDPNSPHSRFVVHVGQPPFYPQSISPFSLVCQGTFFTCNASQAPTAPINCNPVGNFSPIEDPNDENIRMLAALAADSSYSFDEFNESVKYQLRREVELAISQGQITLPDTGIYTNFEQQLIDGPESQYNEVDAKLQQRLLQENADSVLNTLYLSIKQLSQELYMLDSSLVADSMNTDSLLPYQIMQGKQQLSLLNQQVQLITNQANDSYRVEAAEAAVLNQTINNTAFYQEPEKTINEIYLRTIGSEQYTFTEDQIQAIHYIAHMCPAIGGSAVYKARSLYALFNDTISYDDANICLQQGILYRLAQNSSKERVKENVIIYPNPTTDFITIKYLGEELKSFELEITNATGQLVTSKMVTLSSNTATENISQLAKGVYFISLSNISGGINRTLKLVKF